MFSYGFFMFYISESYFFCLYVKSERNHPSVNFQMSLCPISNETAMKTVSEFIIRCLPSRTSLTAETIIFLKTEMVLKLPSSTSKLIFTYVHSFKQQATTNSIKQDILHVQPSASQ